MICSRKDCDAIGVKRHSKTLVYCARHYRVMKMLDYSRRVYPNWSVSYEEIERLLVKAMAEGDCPHCGKMMIFFPENRRRSGMATIQHYDDGTLGIICFTCNLAHSKSELRDKLFLVPKGNKFCPDCQTVKPKSEFHVTHRDLNGHLTYCKPCQNARNRAVKLRSRRAGQFPSTLTHLN